MSRKVFPFDYVPKVSPRGVWRDLVIPDGPKVSKPYNDFSYRKIAEKRSEKTKLGANVAPPGIGSVRMHPQLAPRECGIACLTMLTRYPYAYVKALALEVKKTEKIFGMWHKEVIQVAAMLGYTLFRRKTYDPAEDVGILNVKGVKGSNGEEWDGWSHYVVLYEGLIFDTDLTVYTLQQFKAVYPKGKLCSLLRLEGRCQPLS